VPRGALATRRLSRPRALGDSVPPTGLVLLAVGSVQFGAALARTLFDDLGAGGTVFLRVLFAALVLWALWRPRIRGHTRGELALACAFGLSLAGMNLAFYEALGRIPLGVAVTFEFVGPLGVAVAGSRRALDLLWVALAAAGIVLLTDLGQGGGLNAAGVGFALLAGAFWAAYILLSARTGRVFPGGAGLALAMALGALVLVPVGVASGGNALLEPRLLALGAAVAMLSSAIPYSLELEALRRLPPRVFGVLMSLEPAVAAIAGLVVLGQVLRARELVAIALVVAASAGATRTAPTPPRDA
jgi:inner membrane transporter RhtA